MNSLWLEFSIKDRVVRVLDRSQDRFEEALYIATPPHLQTLGLPFEDNVLREAKYVRAIWNVLSGDKLSVLMYVGQFVDKLRVRGLSGNYIPLVLYTAKRESDDSSIGSRVKRCRRNDESKRDI
jgi:hypothetical protein